MKKQTNKENTELVDHNLKSERLKSLQYKFYNLEKARAESLKELRDIMIDNYGDKNIDCLEFYMNRGANRIFGCLYDSGIETIKDYLNRVGKGWDIYKIKNFGRKSVEEVNYTILKLMIGEQNIDYFRDYSGEQLCDIIRGKNIGDIIRGK